MLSFSLRKTMRQAEAELLARGRWCQLMLEPANPMYRAMDLVSRHLSWQSEFCKACVRMGYLAPEQMERAARRYRLGINRHGAVIFWQIGLQGQVYDGKIMYYKQDCHRDHERKTTWVRAVMKRFYGCEADISCGHGLFGGHLLGLTDDFATLKATHCQRMPVAVVESEKTAVIMSELYPEYLWLATGGLSELTPQKLFVLRGRKVVIFPDTDPDGNAFGAWFGIVRKAEWLMGQKLFVSPLLEQHATKEQKERKIDVADFYFERRH